MGATTGRCDGADRGGFDVPTDTKKAKFYKQYKMVSDFEYQSGLLVVPLAVEPGSGLPAVELVRVHAPSGERAVAFDAEKDQTPPGVPDPNYSGASNDVFLEGNVGVALPSVGNDQTSYRWHVQGVYRYVQLDAREFGVDHLPTGKYPYQTPPENAQILADFVGAGEVINTPLPPDDNSAVQYFADPKYCFLGGYLPYQFMFDDLIAG
jgi:hypothetical protein